MNKYVERYLGHSWKSVLNDCIVTTNSSDFAACSLHPDSAAKKIESSFVHWFPRYVHSWYLLMASKNENPRTSAKISSEEGENGRCCQ